LGDHLEVVHAAAFGSVSRVLKDDGGLGRRVVGGDGDVDDAVEEPVGVLELFPVV
jgi:hypothetical protein